MDIISTKHNHCSS